ncbi:hypothetical protein B0H14DRAFT_3097930 [Mycena olivaceomarginata]|nr:hypothetical protein B0H14DRAFT_3097930 [Mycena olivaceomarginata]
MIARCRSKCWIIQLRGKSGPRHIIIYPQQPSKMADILPHSVEEITSPVCVLFVGTSSPTPEWLRSHAKPLAVNAGRVCVALQWDIKINEEFLHELEQNSVLPFSVEHILPSAANEAATARPSEEIPFQNVVITDVEGHASSNELRAAAFRHVNKKDAENEFRKDSLFFPMIYPTLFPYGIGGPEDV